jgi:cysteine desulfurase
VSIPLAYRLGYTSFCMWFSAKKRIYMDYASAPPVSKAALSAMKQAEQYVGNPGAIHAEGAAALAALENARGRIAAQLSVKPREIIFTSGLTESNNVAIVGHARALERVRRSLEGTHWLVSALEHASVLDCFGEVERLGGEVEHIAPDAKGRIMPEAVKAKLRKETVFVSVGWGNNEIGTVQQLGKIQNVIEAHEKTHGATVLLHSDAGQAPLYLPSTAHSIGVDLMSLGGNKLYGPHGVGALYIGKRAGVARTLQGGPQERKLRPGTESVALALGFAAAYEEAAALRDAESKRLREIRDAMASEIEKKIPGVVINGDLAHALPHMLNISIPHIQSEYLTLQLDRAGFAVSTKSACREGEEQESHVVAALGGGPSADGWRAKNTIRISLGRDTSAQDAKKAAETMARLVNKAAA